MTKQYRNIHEQRAEMQAQIEKDQAARAESDAQMKAAMYESATPLTPAEAAAKRESDLAYQQQQQDEIAARQLKERLWNRYQSAAPGATESEFEEALPRLLQQHRERVALGGNAEIEEAKPSGFEDPRVWGL